MPGLLKHTYNTLMMHIGARIEKRRFNKTPIIIGASPRSGTTILLAILDAHPNVFGIPNQTYAFDDWIEHKTGNGSEVAVRPARIDRLYREFVWNRIPAGVHRWCEKTPKHIQSFGKILDYFDNNAKLIHIVRDGRDVVTSKHPKHNPEQYWVPINRWVADVREGLKYRDHPSVYTLRYEDLILNFQHTMESLCKFLEEPFSRELEDWVRYTAIRKSKHLNEPVQSLYRQSIGRWRREEHDRRVQTFMKSDEAVAFLKMFQYEV